MSDEKNKALQGKNKQPKQTESEDWFAKRIKRFHAVKLPKD